MLGGGGARFLQLREKLVTGVIGLAFVGSAVIGKPLIYELARATMRRKSEVEAQEFEALQVHAGFRRTMMVMTWVWGLGLLADVAVVSLWSFLYGRRAKRRGEERRAAAAQLALGPDIAAGG